MAQELTLEQKRAVAIASARLRLQQQTTQEPSQPPKSGVDQFIDRMLSPYRQMWEGTKGAAKAAGETGTVAAQWLGDLPRQVHDVTTGQQNIFSGVNQSDTPSQLLASPTTATGRDVFQASNPTQELGKFAGNAALGAGVAAATGGSSLPVQVGAMGLTGAAMAPEHPYIGGGAGMAAPLIPAAVQGIRNAIPSADRAAANFQTIMGAAKNQPLNLSAADDIALRGRELGGTSGMPGRGATLPKVLRDYIRHREAGPSMTYEVGRDFQSNAGALSAAENAVTNRKMKMIVGEFAEAMKSSNREAAAKLGFGDLFDSAMKEYRQAKTISEAATIAKKYGERVALGVALYDIYRRISR